MDDHDYRLAALHTWRKAEENADPDLARHYRSLAHAYLALARFHERAGQRRRRDAMPDWAEFRRELRQG